MTNYMSKKKNMTNGKVITLGEKKVLMPFDDLTILFYFYNRF